MPYQVTRTDTGQYVLQDPASDTVVIDDELAAGFAKLEAIVAERPKRSASELPTIQTTGAGSAGRAGAFEFRGGPRYTPILLAVVLPFAWLLALYLVLAHLLAEYGLDRAEAVDTQKKIEELEQEVQALRSEMAGSPRGGKSKPKRTPKPKQPIEAETTAGAAPAEDDVAKDAAGKPEPAPAKGPS